MARTQRTHTILTDSTGKAWVEASLSEAGTQRLIKEYKRAGVELTAHGSPAQLLAQVEAINNALDSNQTARNMRESGHLVVIAC